MAELVPATKNLKRQCKVKVFDDVTSNVNDCVTSMLTSFCPVVMSLYYKMQSR